jgi:serine protease Do
VNCLPVRLAPVRSAGTRRWFGVPLWRRPLFALLPLVALLAVLLAPAGASFAKAGPEGFSDLAAKLLPAVVNISTTQTLKTSGPGAGNRPEMPQFPPGSPFEEFFKDFFDKNMPHGQRPDAQPRKATSLGSGFIIDSSGLIATNNHVIADADEITVTLHDDSTLKAEVIGKDSKTDLALLRVKSDKPLTAVKFGDSDQMKVGDWVLAIGNPFGLGGTVTAGIVSARARDINAGPYDDFIQTDASINRGNSGGPMFNMEGEVVGINTAIYSPSGGSIGIGFAIPAALAKPVFAQLKEYGKARRGWLGVRIQSVTEEIAESLGLDKPRGALVASVSDKGPAKLAGIEPGDIVLSFDGKEIADMRHLPRLVAETPINKSVKVRIWRKHAEQVVDVKVGELEEKEEQQAALAPNQAAPIPGDASLSKTLGLTLSNITPELKQKFSLGDSVSGVVIVEVANDSAASEKGLMPGDIIVEAALEEVKNPAQIAKKVEEARNAGRKSILLQIERAGDLRFVTLRVDAAG